MPYRDLIEQSHIRLLPQWPYSDIIMPDTDFIMSYHDIQMSYPDINMDSMT